MSLIYFILCSYGLTQLLIYGHIFDKIRPDKRFFKCSMCMGFWVGVFLYSINGYTDLFSFEYNWINPLLLGCLSSGTSYILDMVIGDKGIRYESNN
jgi:hypothetical protein